MDPMLKNYLKGLGEEEAEKNAKAIREEFTYDKVSPGARKIYVPLRISEADDEHIEAYRTVSQPGYGRVDHRPGEPASRVVVTDDQSATGRTIRLHESLHVRYGEWPEDIPDGTPPEMDLKRLMTELWLQVEKWPRAASEQVQRDALAAVLKKNRRDVRTLKDLRENFFDRLDEVEPEDMPPVEIINRMAGRWNGVMRDVIRDLAFLQKRRTESSDWYDHPRRYHTNWLYRQDLGSALNGAGGDLVDYAEDTGGVLLRESRSGSAHRFAIYAQHYATQLFRPIVGPKGGHGATDLGSEYREDLTPAGLAKESGAELSDVDLGALDEMNPMKIERLRPLSQSAAHRRLRTKIRTSSGMKLNARRLVPCFIGRTQNGMFVRRHIEEHIGGSVLIDASGSMALSLEDIHDLVTSAPAATIGYYSGAGDTEESAGALFVAAENGKVYQGSARSLPTAGRGNSVDYWALKWLLRQPGPHIFVTDRGFCGGPADQHRAAEAILRPLERRGVVKVVGSLDRAKHEFRMLKRGMLDRKAS